MHLHGHFSFSFFPQINQLCMGCIYPFHLYGIYVAPYLSLHPSTLDLITNIAPLSD
jgi:hypothetical protein